MKQLRKKPKGMAIIYATVGLVAIMGIMSLAIDYGRAQCAKTELRNAVDAAARFASTGLSDGTYLTKAQSAASQNKVDGIALALQSSDIEQGTWNSATRTFTVTSSSPNAVRITGHLSAARGTAIDLYFGRVLGANNVDVAVTTVIKATSSQARGLIGLNGITVKNNASIASYNSAITTNPNSGNDSGNGCAASNGVIDGGNNNNIQGFVNLGAGGSISGFTVTGTTTTATTAIAAPSLPAWNPTTNPNGISQSYTVNSSTILPTGSYWFTSLTVNAPLSFSGPATIYVNGNVSVDSSIKASGSVPSNLTIYQLGSNRTFGDSASNSIDITAIVIAPTSAFSGKNNFIGRGSMIFQTIDVKNNLEFYYDESLGAAGGAPASTITMVK